MNREFPINFHTDLVETRIDHEHTYIYTLQRETESIVTVSARSMATKKKFLVSTGEDSQSPLSKLYASQLNASSQSPSPSQRAGAVSGVLPELSWLQTSRRSVPARYHRHLVSLLVRCIYPYQGKEIPTQARCVVC